MSAAGSAGTAGRPTDPGAEAQLRELRFILFSDEEVVIALLDHHYPNWRRSRQFDIGKARLEIDAQAPEAIRIALLGRFAGTWQRRGFRNEDVLAALLGYCRSARIPLPLRGVKALEMMQGRLAMRVTITVPPPTGWDTEE
jgi:hypothetical protein